MSDDIVNQPNNMKNIVKKINNLKKKNEGMENLCKSKNIKFTKLSIDGIIASDLELMLISDYNNYLKSIVKNNNSQSTQTQPTSTFADKTEVLNENELTKEPKITIPTICNMEDLKRSFFSKDYTTFEQEVLTKNLRLFKANYKWADDNTGKPEYIARNLLRGFVQSLDQYRRHLMVCFRCILTNEENKIYRYPSYWIVNTEANLINTFEDFDFIEVKEPEKMLQKMRKNEDESDAQLIGEMYLH